MFYLPPSLKFVAGIDIPVDSVPLGKAWWTRLLLLLALLAKHRLITAQCLRVWKYKWHKKKQVANKHYHAQCSHTESNSGLSSFLSNLKSRLKGGHFWQHTNKLRKSDLRYFYGMQHLLIILMVKKYFTTGSSCFRQFSRTTSNIPAPKRPRTAKKHLRSHFTWAHSE